MSQIKLTVKLGGDGGQERSSRMKEAQVINRLNSSINQRNFFHATMQPHRNISPFFQTDHALGRYISRNESQF